MLTLWTIEAQRPWEDTLASQLVKDYPVQILSGAKDLAKLSIFQDTTSMRVLFLDTSYIPHVEAKMLVPFHHVIRMPKAQAKLELAVMLCKIGNTLPAVAKQTVGVLNCRDLQLDLGMLEVKCPAKRFRVTLSHKEAQLLGLFFQNPERLIAREELRKEVWAGLAVSPRTIDSQISRLRKKIEGANRKSTRLNSSH